MLTSDKWGNINITTSDGVDAHISSVLKNVCPHIYMFKNYKKSMLQRHLLFAPKMCQFLAHKSLKRISKIDGP